MGVIDFFFISQNYLMEFQRTNAWIYISGKKISEERAQKWLQPNVHSSNKQ